FGSWSQLQPYVVAAAWGALIISAIYMLRAVRSIAHGPLPDRWSTLADANTWRKVPFVLLMASLLAFGIWPRWLTDKITPSVTAIMAAVKSDAPTASRAQQESDVTIAARATEVRR